MCAQQRVYDPALDKQWSTTVYQKAKEVVIDVLKSQGKGVQSSVINEVTQRRHPDLCDDSILDPQIPKYPYWKHRVASAIQSLKKAGQVKKIDHGWAWVETAIHKPEAPPPKPELTPSKPDDDVRLRLRDRLLRLNPEQFENVLGKILNFLGIGQVRVTGRTADGGIDIEGMIPIVNLRVAVQAKRYALGNSVGIDPVQRLIGSVTAEGYDRGLFITTSTFTAGARETAGKPGSRIILVDGERLVDIMMEKGLGVKQIPIVRQDVDEGFFLSAIPK